MTRLNLHQFWKQINFHYDIQKPYDKDLQERYELKDGVHHFWVFKNDKPHTRTSKTHPRTEMAIRTSWRNGKHKFSADFLVLKGTTGTNLMQYSEPSREPSQL